MLQISRVPGIPKKIRIGLDLNTLSNVNVMIQLWHAILALSFIPLLLEPMFSQSSHPLLLLLFQQTSPLHHSSSCGFPGAPPTHSAPPLPTPDTDNQSSRSGGDTPGPMLNPASQDSNHNDGSSEAGERSDIFAENFSNDELSVSVQVCGSVSRNEDASSHLESSLNLWLHVTRAVCGFCEKLRHTD